MKLLKYAVALSIAMSLTNVSYAGKGSVSGVPMYQVPFYNVAIEGKKKIYADYNFDTHTQTLVCKKVSGDAIESVGWEYKGARYVGQLPLELKDDESFSGQWADPDGKLTIKNVFENDPIVVTCEYRNVK